MPSLWKVTRHDIYIFKPNVWLVCYSQKGGERRELFTVTKYSVGKVRPKVIVTEVSTRLQWKERGMPYCAWTTTWKNREKGSTLGWRSSLGVDSEQRKGVRELCGWLCSLHGLSWAFWLKMGQRGIWFPTWQIPPTRKEGPRLFQTCLHKGIYIPEHVWGETWICLHHLIRLGTKNGLI